MLFSAMFFCGEIKDRRTYTYLNALVILKGDELLCRKIQLASLKPTLEHNMVH